MNKYFIVILLFLGTISWDDLNAQASAVYSDPARDFKEAMEIVNHKKYNIAQLKFRDFLEHYEKLDEGKSGLLLAEASYYMAYCAMKTGDAKAEEHYLAYMEEHKGHSKINVAFFDLGNLYFEDKDYRSALDYFEKVDERALPKHVKEEYQFKYAFTLFSLKRFDQARSIWALMKDEPGPYFDDANYYYGMAAYFEDDLAEALVSFRKVEHTPRYRNDVPYYVTQIEFINQNYQQVIDYAVPLMESNRSLRNTDDMHQLVGQSYFILGSYESAIPHLEIYLDKSRQVQKEDYYQLGYAYYKKGEYSKAVDQFVKLNSVKGALAQNSMLLLGKCYIELDDKQNARNAMQRAAAMNHDEVLKEEALFNYAKLSYELDYTNDALTALNNYLKEFENSDRTNEVNNLLAQVLLETKDFPKAMQLIERLEEPSPIVQEAYQQITYFQGVDFYNNRKFGEAEAVFKKALKYRENRSIEALTYYWLADISHMKRDFNRSTEAIKKFLSLSSSIDPAHTQKINEATGLYILGYNQFKTKDYANSVNSFGKCATMFRDDDGHELRGKLMPDALLRTADSYYMLKEYDKAKKYYNIVMNSPSDEGSDYAFLQKAQLEGLQGRYDEKIAVLNLMIKRYPKSSLTDDAIYEVGSTYILLENNAQAINNFKHLIRTYPKSDLVPYCHNKLGLIYFNDDKYREALTEYKTVIERHPRTNASQEALIAIKDVYIAMDDPDGYIRYINTVPDANISMSEQDSIVYVVAENQFAKGNYKEALKGFEEYLLRFPNGYFKLSAHFYRGECHFSFEDFEKAIVDYDYVLNQASSRFTERSLQRSAGINYYHRNEFRKAREQYLLLLDIATTDEVRQNAVLGLLRSSYDMNDYGACINYSNRVLQGEEYSDFQVAEAYYRRANAYFETNKYEDAVNDYQMLKYKINNEWAAEGLYKIALINYKKQMYDESEAFCFEFISNYPSYAEWLVNTYILLADIYIEKDNLFQAKATIQSILDNYTTKDELRARAVKKYQEIENLEKQDSKIFEPDGNNEFLEFDNED